MDIGQKPYETFTPHNGTVKFGVREKNINIRDERTLQLADAHNRANEQAMANRRRRRQPPRQGSVRLSNTDSMGRVNRVRAQLRAKLSEVMSSTLDEGTKKGLARAVQTQLDRVDSVARQIRRRERAEQEERIDNRARERRQESRRQELRREEARRRRRNDMHPRSTRIRRDFLYSASQGGFDPYDARPVSFNGNNGGGHAAVAFDIGGQAGVVIDSAAAPPAADVLDVML